MNRRGTVLLAVLVLSMLASLTLVGLLYQSSADAAASTVAADRRQAYYTALSGVTFAAEVLRVHGDEPEIWRDNPDLFESRPLAEGPPAGAVQWRFTVWSPAGDDEETRIRYGASDEAARLHLATLDANAAARLEPLTDEQAASLLDYLDQDNDARPLGAEQAYYSALGRPYVIRNGPPGTVGELLLVKGFTGATLWGEDYNRNGLLDAGEDDGPESFPPDDADGQLRRGVGPMLTVWSYDPDVRADGSEKLDLNRAGADALRAAGLSETTAKFIAAYRAEGGRFAHPAELLEMRYQLEDARENKPRRRWATHGLSPDAQGWVASGVGAEDLAVVLEASTAEPGPKIGRVNVNSAGQAVLAALPGLDADSARRIVSARSALDADARGTIAWLVRENLLPVETFKKVAPRLTARSGPFRVRVLGLAADPAGRPVGAFCSLEAVIDLATGTPAVLYLRDVTELGAPMTAPETLREER